MSSMSPDDPNGEATDLGRDDRPDKYLDDVMGEAKGLEAEGPYGGMRHDDESTRAERWAQAKQARAQALAHERAARAARARYMRMAPRMEVHNPGYPDKTYMEGSGQAADQGRRIGSIEAAVAATPVVQQFQTSFPDVATHPLAKAGLSVAPLLLLRPERHGSGLESFVTDPRVLAGALVFGLSIAGEVNRSADEVHQVRITRPQPVGELRPQESLRALADALDRKGNPIPDQRITWSSDNQAVATVTADGEVRGESVGSARVRASVGDKSDFVTVRVEDRTQE